ncbi:MAG: NAD-dependent epimerase/dehydratase family protein [Bacteroidales bacterium]
MSGDFTGLREDLGKRPVEGVNGDASEASIRAILGKYGVTEDKVTLWGTGSPLREFLHVNDMAAACVYLMMTYDAPELPPSHVNIGSGTDLSIRALAEKVQQIVGYPGQLVWDTTKPDGTPRKLMDNTKLKSLGFQPKISLDTGIAEVYQSYTL